MQIVVLCTHWSACGFYYVARLYGFEPDFLVGTNQPFFLTLDGAQQYVYSIYWAVQTLTSSEYGNPSPGRWMVSSTSRTCCTACTAMQTSVKEFSVSFVDAMLCL